MASSAREHLRACVRLFGFAALTLGAGAILLTERLLLGDGERGRPLRERVFRIWAHAVARLLQLRVHVEGQPLDRAHLLVTNHLSYLDVVALASLLPATFVAKSEVAGWPLMGAACRWAGTIFVERRKLRGVLPALDAMQNCLDHGENVVLFPEGTSSPGQTVLPFRSSLFEAAVRSRVPVASATLSYRVGVREEPATTSVCWWGDMPFLNHLYALLRHRSIDARLKFSSRVLEGSDRKTLAADTHGIVQAQLSPTREPIANRHSLVQRISDQCCGLLGQAAKLLDELDDETLAWSAPGFERSRLGDHFRHVIDYYQCLVIGARQRVVDYDRRERSAEMAQNGAYARRRIRELIERIETEVAYLPSIPLRVRTEEIETGSPDAWLESNLARELRFLHGHTIHHFAMISLHLRLQEIPVPEDFGVALSTLREWGRRS